MGAGAPPYLQCGFGDPHHRRHRDRVGAQDPARRIDGRPRADMELAFAQHRHRLADRGKPRRLDRVKFGVGERRVQLGNVHLLRRILDPGHPVSALEALAQCMGIGVVGDVVVAHPIADVIALGAVRHAGDPDRLEPVLLDVALAREHDRTAAARLGAGVEQLDRPGDVARGEHVLDGNLLAQMRLGIEGGVGAVLDRDARHVLFGQAVFVHRAHG